MIEASHLRNPIWSRADNLRDPTVLAADGGYYLFYSRFSNNNWGLPENWAIARAFTRDFVTFSDDRDISPKGFASPGDPVIWHGRRILPYQSYPVHPCRLFYSASADGRMWSDPQPFLPQANDLPWNTRKRVIDPTLVVSEDELHCFFVGSCDTEDRQRHANLLGHARTRDPQMRDWEITTQDDPLIGRSAQAFDGVENVAVFRVGEEWTMIYSEGLANQHLAYASSSDLRTWRPMGRLQLPVQTWMSAKYGAPCVFRDGERWAMVLMGQDAAGRTTFGFLTSPDGIAWTAVPER